MIQTPHSKSDWSIVLSNLHEAQPFLALTFWNAAPDRPSVDIAVQVINSALTKPTKSAQDLALAVATEYAPRLQHQVLNHAIQANHLAVVNVLLPYYDAQKDPGLLLRTAVLENNPAVVQTILSHTTCRPDLTILNNVASREVANVLAPHCLSADLVAWCASKFQGPIPPKAADLPLFAVYWGILSDQDRSVVWDRHAKSSRQWLSQKIPSVAAWSSAKDIERAVDDSAVMKDKSAPAKKM